MIIQSTNTASTGIDGNMYKVTPAFLYINLPIPHLKYQYVNEFRTNRFRSPRFVLAVPVCTLEI